MRSTSFDDCLKTSLPVGGATRKLPRTELAPWYIALFMGVKISSMVECPNETSNRKFMDLSHLVIGQ
ncbi:unnamed protein product [Lasius platythorax]|uniref:Uncharacterized protein n=1 Tax=Lasius platythorax TaxID=488582 RepID=A0AAV2N1Z0_9HYME